MSLIPHTFGQFGVPVNRSARNFFRLMDEMFDVDCPLRRMELGGSGLNSLADCHVQNDDNKFQLHLNARQFQPEELKVKLEDGILTIEGNHEERDDEFGSVKRHFLRRYTLPQEAQTDQIKSELTPDGVLGITVPKKQQEKRKNIEIPIQKAIKR